MRKISFVFAVLSFFAVSASYGQGDSCLKLLGHIHGDSTWMNPDSIRVDSCIGSPTYGHRFAVGRFFFEFTYGSMLALPAYPEDTTIEVDWESIDTSYHETREGFEALENTFGSFALRKIYPQVSDTVNSASRRYNIVFSSVVDVDSIETYLHTIPLIEGENYLDRSGITSGVKEKDLMKAENLLVYPNPTSKRLRLLSASEAIYTSHIDVYNTEGELSQRIKAVYLSNKEIELDVSMLSIGKYFAVCNGESFSFEIIR